MNLSTITGLVLVIIALIDIYLTVLHPRIDSNLLSAPLSQIIWFLFRFVAKAFPRIKKQIFSHSGSVIIIIIVATWLLLLLFGFALIVWPTLGYAIQSNEGNTQVDFTAALYYSGYSLTTLGTGDLVPKTDFHRLLMVFQAAIGFSIFTLTITYILAVYSSIIKRNTFALSMYHRSGETADSAELLAKLISNNNTNNVQQDISNMARDLIDLLESQKAYPVLLYINLPEVYYSLPRILFLVMDVSTLIKSALHEKKYRSLINSAAAAELWGGGTHLLNILSTSLLPKQHLLISEEEEKMWRKRYYLAVEILNAANIKTITNLEEGADLYVALRRKWIIQLSDLIDYMAYNWSEIAPHENHPN
jgi:hypothetical protein